VNYESDSVLSGLLPPSIDPVLYLSFRTNDMPGPDYTLFAITDLSMCTSLHNGDTSFLLPYSTGARLKTGENLHEDIDPSYGFENFLNSMDILLCGRHTYDHIMHHAQGQWPYPRKRLIVFSATPLSEPLNDAGALCSIIFIQSRLTVRIRRVPAIALSSTAEY
jgi:hypothetical protein